MKIGFRCSEGGQVFDEALREVERGEELGFDSVWVAEHQGWDIYWPTSHIALAAFAARTEEIDLGTSITLLSQTNPIRLAGEANLVDRISDGRFHLGVGVGWHEREMENLGYDFETRGPRTTEHMKAMNALWAEDVASFDGEFVSFEDFELTPEPVQDPHPPVFVGGGVDVSLRRAAYLGDAWFPLWLESIEELEPKYERYREYVRETGDDPGEREEPILRIAWIDEDRDVARDRIEDLVRTMIQAYMDLGLDVPEPMEDIVAGRGDFEELADGRLIYGDPEEVTERILAFEALDVDHMVLKLSNPGVDHERIMEFLDLLGEDVLPHVQDSPSSGFAG